MTTWGLLALGWLSGLVLLWRPPRLDRTRSAVELPGSVSIVVPARDEAANLPTLLGSLSSQVGLPSPPEVIVVDDGSSDGTAAVARAHGALVVEGSPPPVGWLGKPWALAQGAAAATGEVLVLVDADVAFAPDGLARVLAAHASEAPDGLLSVQPHHHARRAHEQLSLLPNVVSLLASGIGALGRSRHQSDRVAFGPCLVTTRDALDAIGGVEVVAGSVVEDLALARAYRAKGRTVRCRTGGALVRFHMYPEGLGSLVQGWTKNLAAGATSAPLLATVGAVLWVTGLLASLGVVAAAAGRGAWLLAAVVWAAEAGQVWWAARRVGRFHLWASLLYPVPVVAFVAMFAASAGARVTGRPVTWRGRRIRAGQVVD